MPFAFSWTVVSCHKHKINPKLIYTASTLSLFLLRPFTWLSGLTYSKNQWLWSSEECKSIYSGRISRSNALNPEGVPFTTSTAYLEVDPGIDVVPVQEVRGELFMRVDPGFVPEVAVPDHSEGGIYA